MKRSFSRFARGIRRLHICNGLLHVLLQQIDKLKRRAAGIPKQFGRGIGLGLGKKAAVVQKQYDQALREKTPCERDKRRCLLSLIASRRPVSCQRTCDLVVPKVCVSQKKKLESIISEAKGRYVTCRLISGRHSACVRGVYCPQHFTIWGGRVSECPIFDVIRTCILST